MCWFSPSRKSGTARINRATAWYELFKYQVQWTTSMLQWTLSICETWGPGRLEGWGRWWASARHRPPRVPGSKHSWTLAPWCPTWGDKTRFLMGWKCQRQQQQHGLTMEINGDVAGGMLSPNKQGTAASAKSGNRIWLLEPWPWRAEKAWGWSQGLFNDCSLFN